MTRVPFSYLNGRLTPLRSYDVAKPEYDASNYWSSSEYNANNAWNVNFSSGNATNNNKYNSNVVRASAALGYDSYSEFFDSVLEAYYDCLRGKQNALQAIEYMAIAQYDLPVLARELWEGTYQPTTSTCFLVYYPKLREVFAANFRDRIVHHWICLRLVPFFEERFRLLGDVSFNCRKGYGTDKAVAFLASEIERVSCNYRKPAWVFRGDISGFFMSIQKDRLWYLLERFIRRSMARHERGVRVGEPEDMYWQILIDTARKIVMHHPELDCIINSPVDRWRQLDANKSLFTSENGEPIGNLTTQHFANFFMAFFVLYLRWIFRGKNYGMAIFVDDFAVVCDDKKFLLHAVALMENFLHHSLGLVMHRDKRYIQPVSHGVLFVGSYIKPRRSYLSNRTLARMEERCHGFRILFESGEVDGILLSHIECVLNSYLGFCKRRRTYKRRRRLVEGMGRSFWQYFYVRGSFCSVRLRECYRQL